VNTRDGRNTADVANAALNRSADWTTSFKPVTSPTDHRWRINDGDATHGYGVICAACGLELVPCVDLVGRAPRAVLYVAGVGGKYTPKDHGRCTPKEPSR